MNLSVISGKSTVPAANPAFNLTAILGANPLPAKEFKITTTVAFSEAAALLITDEYDCELKSFNRASETFKTLAAPYFPKAERLSLLTFPIETTDKDVDNLSAMALL